MRDELFAFQKKAVDALRLRAAEAVDLWQRMRVPQVISLQAPTGAGKTIIMASLIEDILFGTERFEGQGAAIFVWLSDSPALNEQSKAKIDLKADKIRLDQCVTIDDASFDMECLEDGRIYFLNTQKLSITGNLGRASERRQYTIWQTLQNTAERKADRLYFIIDEAHRGMQGRDAGRATSIMQRFIKGSPAHGISPLPVVIGMSATAERFNQLVGDTSSTLHRVIITADDVRSSGLLKERIFITYPEDPNKQSDMAVLEAAADEWLKKCEQWSEYCASQKIEDVRPVFVVQVQAGSSRAVSATNLDDVIEKIEERLGERLAEGEVVHTFGSSTPLKIAGHTVPYIKPEDITEAKRVRVVLFKESLSTGWDCPRAEAMMSFRRAEDATYIAQLLGRMVRAPLHCRIGSNEYLNDVRLFLPYFNRNTVSDVVRELQSAESGEIPTEIEGEPLGGPKYELLSGNPAIVRRINELGLLTFKVRSSRINSYIKSLLNIAYLLTTEDIYPPAVKDVRGDVVEMIRKYIEDVKASGQYEKLIKKTFQYKLVADVFDAFGAAVKDSEKGANMSLFAVQGADLDRMLRQADARTGCAGFAIDYGKKYFDADNPSAHEVDFILFASDDACIEALNKYAQGKFAGFTDAYRRYIVGKSEDCRRRYDEIVADSGLVTKHSFTLPETISVKTDEGGKLYCDHLYVNKEGFAKIKLNSWEEAVIAEEAARPDFLFWLRNPPREKWALCIPYKTGGEDKAMYPDFIIAREDNVTGCVVDILEPHSPALKDNLDKAKGLASYAQAEMQIGRVQLIRQGRDAAGKSRLKRLDMSRRETREKVLRAASNEELDHLFDADNEV